MGLQTCLSRAKVDWRRGREEEGGDNFTGQENDSTYLLFRPVSVLYNLVAS